MQEGKLCRQPGESTQYSVSLLWARATEQELLIPSVRKKLGQEKGLLKAMRVNSLYSYPYLN
jgi:hypothetical protein